ncbi:MAG: magnesium/cobalt transporter CorA [Candidatus Heimdallarchaeota archaeon]|nr:magnesium/cobalt transporter CorA [Candidatus Heimdallarchaeota archaeon]
MPYRIKKSTKIGLPPGVSQYSGDIQDSEIEIEVIHYKIHSEKKEIVQEKVPIEHLGTKFSLIGEQSVTWIDIQGFHDEKLMKEISAHFNFHPILTEDLLSTLQRPKLDIYDDHIVFFLRRVFDDLTTPELETDQIVIVLGKNYVLSFNELNDNKFNKVKKMIQEYFSLFTRHGNDFLAYILLDYIIDTYFIELERVSDTIELLEDQIYLRELDDMPDKINKVKKKNLGMRKIVTPLRDMPSKLVRLDIQFIQPSTKPFLKDLEDHIYQLIEMVETNRDIIPNLKEGYSSQLNHRMNEVMMTLTVVSSILLPLTFITSLYGMNFSYMPELNWKMGYFATWGVMITITILLTIYFKRRGWL